VIVEEEVTEVQVQRPISPEPAPALKEESSAKPAPPKPAPPAPVKPAPPEPAPAMPAPPAPVKPAPPEPAPAEKAAAPATQAARDLPPYRTWTDITGNYHTQAQLVDVLGDAVRLLKSNGRTCRVPLDRLSVADRQYVDAIQLIASVN
jgi:hypothetical protein